MHKSNRLQSVTKYGLLWALLLVISLSWSCDNKVLPRDPQSRPDLAMETFDQINRLRLQSGLNALTWESPIADAALGHSMNMALGKAVFGHDGFSERIESLRSRYSFSSAGENIGYVKGYDRPVDEIIGRWMQNAEHRDNILGAFHLSGVGVVEGPDGEIFTTQLFLRAK